MEKKHLQEKIADLEKQNEELNEQGEKLVDLYAPKLNQFDVGAFAKC